ncbi:SPRY domain-containing SOCS box protein 3-like [Condylostylus longicornis]|uniref:SPRY domain-containing SOCS box protein 3-like n=1 Tax=Condylostylus longicornis TaxID=2530218 RepID=UPI00244DD05A|nr:SPRY domain-containing SOCS box protein 3-like [Condylostylus longicornis]
MPKESDFYLSGNPPNTATATPPFCNCEFPRNIDVLNNKNIHDLYNCKCIENGYLNKYKEWIWDKNVTDSDTYINGPDITFHPIYSQGTSFVRGEKILKPNYIHYWEMQIITTPSGTDEMFGIGTDKIDLNKYKYRFVSGLGRTNQSWGFSYRGLKTHKGIALNYGKTITQGCIVGIYLDLYRGHLEFYLNRKPLGIAFTNIPKDINLYPMVCSTSSRCAIRLINSISQPVTLQFLAMHKISKRSDLLDELKKMPGLKPILNEYWFLIPITDEKLPRNRLKKFEFSLLGDEYRIFANKRTKKSKLRKEYDDDLDIKDTYTKVKIPKSIKEQDDGDDELNKNKIASLC